MPTQCYHISLEDHFERPKDDVLWSACGNNCTFCTNAHLEFTRQFVREDLVDVLMLDVFGEGKVTLFDFAKKLTEGSLQIWGGDEQFHRTLEPGNIHALALQLVAARFVDVFVPDEKLIGKEKLNKSEIFVKLAKEDGGRRWRIRNESLWSHHGFNCR